MILWTWNFCKNYIKFTLLNLCIAGDCIVNKFLAAVNYWPIKRFSNKIAQKNVNIVNTDTCLFFTQAATNETNFPAINTMRNWL